jgi:hypothetical protein
LAIIMYIPTTKLHRQPRHHPLALSYGSAGSGARDGLEAISIRIEWVESHDTIDPILPTLVEEIA